MARRTIEEVEELKSRWNLDSDWNIENTEGFEDHYDELLDYRCLKILERRQKAIQKLKDKAFDIGCPDDWKLVEYVMSLEKRIERLENA